MKRFNLFTNRFILAAAAAALAAGSALADPKPYAPVDVTFAREVGHDPDLRATIERLKDAVEARDISVVDAALAEDFTVLTCGMDPTQACAAGSKNATPAKGKTAAERLRAGLCCADLPAKDITDEIRVETALGLVGAMLASDAIGANPDIAGSACLPAWPSYDRAAAAAVAKAADVEPENLRATAAEVTLRVRAEPGAPELARIPARRVAPLVTLGQEGIPPGWTAVALPQGGLGYTQQAAFDDLTAPALCFAKAANGWAIKLITQSKDEEE